MFGRDEGVCGRPSKLGSGVWTKQWSIYTSDGIDAPDRIAVWWDADTEEERGTVRKMHFTFWRRGVRGGFCFHFYLNERRREFPGEEMKAGGVGYELYDGVEWFEQ